MSRSLGDYQDELNRYFAGSVAAPGSRHPSTLIQFRCADESCDARWWQAYLCVAEHDEQHDCPHCHRSGRICGHRYTKADADSYDELHADREEA